MARLSGSFAIFHSGCHCTPSRNALAAGMDTALVLTGSTEAAALAEWTGVRPTHVLASVAELPALFDPSPAGRLVGAGSDRYL